jgi:hypothetical protein
MQDFQLRQIAAAAARPAHRVRGVREPLTP